MTGFGRAEIADDRYGVCVEISSVNRKQADIACHLPRELAELESAVRKSALARISRGRLTIGIRCEQHSGEGQIKLDRQRARALEKAYQELSELLGRDITPGPSDFLRATDIFHDAQESPDLERARALILPALDTALDQLTASRRREGEDLLSDLETRLRTLAELIEAIEKRGPASVSRHRECLHQRLRELGLDLDPADERFLKEIALYAERCDISEEVTRLRSHLTRFHEYLAAEEAVGRSLDFLCQEINREFNTIGSKAADAPIAQHVVSAKSELEKIREQVQNIE